MAKKLLLFLIPLALIFFFYQSYFGPVGNSKSEHVFVVPKNQDGFDVIEKLVEGKYVRSKPAFEFFRNFLLLGKVQSGGYTLSDSMSAWDVLKKLNNEPDMVWISFGGCLRKEQIGEIIGHALGWDSAELMKWNTQYTELKPEYKEGVYYPDTYLVPRNEPGDKIAKRLIARFNEKLAPYAQAFLDKNERWVTGVKIASLIAREAAGKQDMHIISGIIWNRLDEGMPLQIDSTMQYTLGKNKQGQWWGPIDLNEKENDSPYNSYLHKGLPPTPICSPSIDYIEAALNPAETDCIFYLHDANENIHCSKTYEEHLDNIKKYLD